MLFAPTYIHHRWSWGLFEVRYSVAKVCVGLLRIVCMLCRLTCRAAIVMCLIATPGNSMGYHVNKPTFIVIFLFSFSFCNDAYKLKTETWHIQ